MMYQATGGWHNVNNPRLGGHDPAFNDGTWAISYQNTIFKYQYCTYTRSSSTWWKKFRNKNWIEKTEKKISGYSNLHGCSKPLKLVGISANELFTVCSTTE